MYLDTKVLVEGIMSLTSAGVCYPERSPKFEKKTHGELLASWQAFTTLGWWELLLHDLILNDFDAWTEHQGEA